MSLLPRVCSVIALLIFTAGTSSAATPKEIDDAIKKGVDALRQWNYNGLDLGRTALAGIAMLESQKVPINDPAMKTVIEMVRTGAWGQFKTYELSLCLMFLDRLEDPTDDILIQILGVRLVVGQTTAGGWNYNCIAQPTLKEVAELQAIKPIKQAEPDKLHPEVEKYHQKLVPARTQGQGPRDDNSNTQFAVIAVWLSRRHGVPTEAAFQAIETRFMTTQGANGSWAYPGPPDGNGQGAVESASPAMYCAGLIGLSTAMARRQERRTKAEAANKKEESPKKDSATEPKKTTPDDPFFNPPLAPAKQPKAENNQPNYRKDEKDEAVARAFAGLGQVVAASNQAGRGSLILEGERGGKHGFHDLYFYWSLERVCVIYGYDKLGGVDWYEAGAHTLVSKQAANGTWLAGGSYGAEVHTSFAVLFLLKSNLARDLRGKVTNKLDTTMKNTKVPEKTTVASGPKDTLPPGEKTNTTPIVPIAPGAVSEAATMAYQLIQSNTEKEWSTQLKKLNESRGVNFTEALVTAANRLDGDRLKQTRQALADRLARMTPETLRIYAKSEEPELRRGALLGMAQKDDKKFIPDLIDAILDDEEIVIRAAKAGLRSLTEQDFGPANNANKGEKKLAFDDWQIWLKKQKK
jgi:hypothetical protein